MQPIEAFSKPDDAQLQEAARRAKSVVLARCVSVEVKAIDRYGGSPFTFYQFETLRLLHGDLKKSFTLRLFGGRSGDSVVSSEHVPEFLKGGKYVLLLGEPNKDGFPVVSAGSVFEVIASSDRNGERVVPVGSLGIRGRELESFLSELQQMIKS